METFAISVQFSSNVTFSSLEKRIKVR